MQKKLSYVNHAVSLKTQLPILLNLLVEAKDDKLKVAATDLEIAIETVLPATIVEEGATTIPAKTITELISSLSDDMVTLTSADTTLELVSKKTKSVFPTTASEEFPKLYEEKGELIAEMEAEQLHKDLSSVVFAASTDTTRPALSGVLVRREVDGFLLVATDGFRLSLRHYKAHKATEGEEHLFIVPARVFKELLSLKEESETIKLYVSESSKQILFEQGDTTLVGRLIEATFPNYEKIIPTDFSVNVTFDREEMQKAVKICSIFARDSANIIKFSLKEDHIIVSSETSSVGENTVRVDAVLKGEENEIAFNAKYLIDLFANVDVKEMQLEMVGPLNPGVFKIKDDPSYLHLIMPIRVQG